MRNRGNTLAFAHEGSTKFTSIQTNHRGDALIQDLYDEFVNEQRGPKLALSELLLEIRFVFPKILLVSTTNIDCQS